MITGKTSKGFEFVIDETKLNDMEYVDALAEAQENSIMFSKVLKLTLGEEQKKRLYDSVRTEDGRVPIEEIISAFDEIMEASADTKN